MAPPEASWLDLIEPHFRATKRALVVGSDDLGLPEAVRPGFQAIRFVTRIKADAPRAKLEELCEYLQRTSPVLDIIRKLVPGQRDAR